MTEYLDSAGCAPAYASLVRKDETEDWHKIDGKTLESFTVTFSFTDLKGYRFYLPAYMIWAVKKLWSGSIIIDHMIYSINPKSHQFEAVPFMEWFTREQVMAMVMFLEFYITNSDEIAGRLPRQNLQMIRGLLGAR